MLDFRAFQPVLGRKFHVESEFEVRNSRFKRPEGKNKEKLPQKKKMFLNFVFLLFGLWTQASALFDLKFGFYVKFPTQNRLEMSRIMNPGSTNFKIIL